MWETLHMGTLKIAPDDVLIVSPFTGALPLDWITIQSIAVHSAVLTIAPKFLTSDNWSNINNEIDLGFDSIKSLKSEIVKKFIGEIVATTPWWFLGVSLFNFSTGT